MNEIEFEFCTRLNGHNEFAEFLNKLPLKDPQKLLATIKNIEENDIIIVKRMKWIKKINSDIYEIRFRSGQNIQRGLYFMSIITNA